MQKKIIALAIAAALTAPALAMADAPTVYGAANLSIDMTSTSSTAATNSLTNNNLVSNESNLGVKGSEALGNGLTGVYQIEGTIGMNGGTNGAPGGLQTNGQVIAGTTTMTGNPGFALDRDTFIGVAGGFGTVVAGQHDTPYKIADRGLDVFADNVADNRSLMGNVGSTGLTQDARVQDAIAYISPAMSGLTIAAATVFGAGSATPVAAGATAQGKGKALSLAALYSNGPIFADAAYQSITLGDVGTGDLGSPVVALQGTKATGLKGGVGFNGGAFAANLVIEKASITVVGSTATTNTNMYLAGKFNLSATDAVKAAYTKQGDQSTNGTTTKTGAARIALGYDHELTKASTVYALFSKTTPTATGAATSTVLSAGYKHSF